jgi:hypothetical protein
MKSNIQKAIFHLLILVGVSSCETIQRDIELPLPEVFLTSTITDITQTKVQVRGERGNVRNNDSDVFGVVYSEKPLPTIEDSKLSIAANNGSFDVTASNLKSNTVYYFRAYIQTKDKVYYSNQLISSGQYDNRWKRQDDIPEKFKYYTGTLFFYLTADGKIILTLLNAEDSNSGFLPFWNYYFDYENGFTDKKTWFKIRNFNFPFITGVQEMMIMNPSLDRTIVGGGFSINGNLPIPRVYNKRIIFMGQDGITEFTTPMPTEGETIGMNVGTRFYAVETRNLGTIWEYTNLEAQRRNTHTFQNLGRVMAAGTKDKGYVISEGLVPNIKGGILYEYDAITDNWTTKRAFTGEDRRDGIMFECKGKIYYGLGKGKKSGQILKDIWEYTPAEDNWKQVAFYPGNGNINLVQTQRNGVVYLGMGYQTTLTDVNGVKFSGVKDMWTFTPN